MKKLNITLNEWGKLPLITNIIRLWNKWDEDHMLNEEDEEVWCS